jgi:hypothetical protein
MQPQKPEMGQKTGLNQRQEIKEKNGKKYLPEHD